MRSWIEGGFKLLNRGGWQWQATRMTDPDRVERLWLVLAVATRYVLVVGGEADEAEFASATVPEPAGPSAKAATGPEPASSGPGTVAAAPPRCIAGADRPPAAVRRTGTKQRLVSVFRQGLAVLLSIMIAGHALPKPSWKPEAWLEIRCEIKPPLQQPPTPIPKTPSL